MDIVIAGGHGKIGLRLGKLLIEGGHRVRGIVRNPDHAPDLDAAGIEPVVADMEREASLTPLIAARPPADAVVFAAGAGPGSGPERKQTVDLGAAVKLIDAARESGARRYLIVSSIGAHDPASGGEQMRPYLEAKAAADEAVAASGLDFTIVRPGGLTDDPGTGLVDASTTLGRRGPIPRDDVAATLAACLDEPATIGKTFELFSGDTPIAEALRGL
jgi:uncharacterized protein YbjT (DUF2867 family)